MALETKELTNDLIKSVAVDAMVSRGVCPDINTCFSPGCWQITPATKNIPSSVYPYAILQVSYTSEYGYGEQRIITRGESGLIYWRTFNLAVSGYGLSSWLKLQGTPLT